MGIILKDITNENWIKCICLTTNKDNTNTIFEEFVASNAVSIAQSKVQEGWITKAIYNNDTMVGFTMYGYSNEYKFYELCRLMIDYKYQQSGYGTETLLKVIDEMRNWKECKEIFLSFDPENIVGKKLYESLGFKNTGKFIDDELLYKLTLK
jgi:diamine N-acetyltransferase